VAGAERGCPEVEIRPGDVVWCPPREKHWHGATSTTAMTHIAIVEKLDGKAVDWMEKVQRRGILQIEENRFMYNAKAYAAGSVTSPLALTTIPRREPTESDIQIEILFCASATLIFIRFATSGVTPCRPSIHASRS